MGKFCIKCGNENEEGSKFCTACGNPMYQGKGTDNNAVSTNVSSNNEVNDPDYDKKGNIFGIISLILFYGGSILSTGLMVLFDGVYVDAFESLIALCPLAGIVTLIVGRVKYPKNKLLKIAMWIMIAGVVISIVLTIIVIIACAIVCSDTLSGCGNMG